MRILIDARYLDGTFSGIGTYSQQLLENLARVDEQTEYYVLVRPGFNGRLHVGDNFKLMAYSPRPISINTLTSLGGMVDSLGVDLMHSFFPLAPLRMKTPLMVTVHDLQPFTDPDFSARRAFPLQWAYGQFYRYIYPATLRHAKWILNVSYHTRDEVAEHFQSTLPKLMVVTSGLCETIFDPPREAPRVVRRRHELFSPYVLYYGSTRPNKNLPTMIRAFSHYVRKDDDKEMELVLILKKDRFFREIARAIRQEGLYERVRVLDQVAPSEQRAILADARLFLFATKYEGFGFPALEAMAAGIPVIAGDSGALPEICGKAAFMVDPASASEIGDAMDIVIHDEEIRQELITAGKNHARKFDWQDAAEQVRDIYRLLF